MPAEKNTISSDEAWETELTRGVTLLEVLLA